LAAVPENQRRSLMPVFTRLRDGVLVLTVDGDFTANELRRVTFRAFEDTDMPVSVPVLLDMSGAAGVSAASSEELQATAAIFGAYRDRITGLAVVAAADVQSHFSAEGEFAREAGLAVLPCNSHADARAWLETAGD
jgi:hypothetical protein